MRGRLRAFGFGLATLLGRRRGFFIPYRYADAVVPSGYPALEPVFFAARDRILSVLGAIDAHAADLSRIAQGRGPARFDQDWFPGLDAAAAYALVRQGKPARIVEIGSGHSTRFLAAAVTDGALPTQIVCIDPAPRASLAALALRHEACLLDEVDPTLLSGLGEGDILFVDSSHIAMPGSDVDRLLLDVLPGLAAGVLVHVHDIFLPDAYPQHWNWRGYNEQIAIGALLQGGFYEIVFASRWARTRLADRLAQGVMADIPLPAGAYESSLWLRKRAAPGA